MSRLFRTGLSVLSGLLLSLAWLGFPGWTLFVAFIPLLVLERFFVENRKTYRGVSFWGHTFLAFLIWNGITTWWISYATVAGAAMAIVVNAFLMSLVWWLGHTARRKFRSNLGYLALVVFWISFEFFHFHWDIEWPWLTLGNGFANNVKMVQWYEFTGTLGGSLWILLLNILLFKISTLLKQKPEIKSILYPVSGFIVILVFPVAYSYFVYYNYTEKENPIAITVVQPNIDPYSERYDQEAENEKLKKFLNLAEKKLDKETDLVIGPETVFERYTDWRVDKLALNPIFRKIENWTVSYPETEVIFGASTMQVYKNPEDVTATARSSNGIQYDVFNSALFVGQSGQHQIYHKSILVVGVEKMPFMKYLSFLLRDIVFNLGGTTGSLGRQVEPTNFQLKNDIDVAPVICYESVFGEYLTQYVTKGAQLIVIITNDGWWRNTPGYKQHLSFARLRAIETRRSIARSANTGISAFINQRGDLLKTTGWWTEASINETLNLNDEKTFYVKYGDFIARISLFVSGLLLLFMIAKKFMPR